MKRSVAGVITVGIVIAVVLALWLVETRGPKKYALILTGDSKYTESLDNNFLKYSEGMYRVLKERYGCGDNSIIFLYDKGEGDSSIIDGDARKNTVAETFFEREYYIELAKSDPYEALRRAGDYNNQPWAEEVIELAAKKNPTQHWFM